MNLFYAFSLHANRMTDELSIISLSNCIENVCELIDDIRGKTADNLRFSPAELLVFHEQSLKQKNEGGGSLKWSVEVDQQDGAELIKYF